MTIEHELKELHDCSTTIANMTLQRNNLIVKARIDGWPWQTIADMTGLSLSGVHKIARSLNEGSLPSPARRRKPSFE